MAAGGGGGGGGAAKNSTGKSTTTTNTNKNKKPNTQNENGLHYHHHHHNHRLQNLTQLITLAASATTAAHSFHTLNDLRLLPSQSLSLESSLSSTSLSLSKLLSVLPLPPTLPQPPLPPPRPLYFHRFLSSPSPNWTESFRMSKPSFSLLLRLLKPSLSSLSPIPPNYALAAALFRLAHSASYVSLATRFGLGSPATACRTFYLVCKAINDQLGHLFELRSDIKRIIAGFGWISLPNCCGVLGFDQFRVSGDLLGENGCLLVQGLVDSEGRFLDVSAGWPSTMSPAAIFQQSELFSGVEEIGDLLNGPSFELGDGNLIPQYILGDSCFPLLPWILTPFSDKTGLKSYEQAFNSAHNRGMELVDTAFGRIRMQWQLISKEWKEECVEAFPFVMVTCCLLHNFLIKCSEPLPDINVGYSRDDELPVYEGEVGERAWRIRNALASYMSRVSQRR